MESSLLHCACYFHFLSDKQVIKCNVILVSLGQAQL